MITWVPFNTWAELRQAVDNHEPIAYQGPMDFQPEPVRVSFRKTMIEVFPLDDSYVSFLADERYLNCFRKQG